MNLAAGAVRGENSFSVSCPDDSISAVVALKCLPQPYPAGERLYYRVLWNKQTVLTDSPLGLDFKGMSALDHGFEVIGKQRESHHSTRDFPFGAKSRIRDNYDELTLSLRERLGPGGLIENSHLVLSLSAPSVLSDTSWIVPGKSAWNWWSGTVAHNVGFTPGTNTATRKHYVDFAADHHLEYMLIDGGWAAILRPAK
jgi:hypothetical protein